MKQLHNDNYWANGITAINILFVLAFIGIIVGGYLISASRISGVGTAFTKEEVIKPVINPFQKPAVYVSSTPPTKAFADVKKKPLLAGIKDQIEEQEQVSEDGRQAELNDQEKAMLSTLLMLLKYRKSADGQFN